MSGQLGPGDNRQSDDSYYDTYRFRALAGDRIRLVLRSQAFDAYLAVQGPSGFSAEDDDSAGGTDAQIQFTAPATGEYRVAANSLNAGEVGPYVLTLSHTSDDCVPVSSGGCSARLEPVSPPPPPPSPPVCPVGTMRDEATLQCAPIGSAPPPAPLPPPPAPVELPRGTVQGGIPATENAQVARAYLTAGQPYRPYRDNLPFGVILLRRNDTERNRAVCNSFVNNLPDPDIVLEADPEANVIATYWLLRRGLSGDDLLDCDRLLAEYDYGRAQRIRGDYGKANSRGPVFLALQLNEGLGAAPFVALLDLSAQSPAQAGRTTIDWFSIVVRPEEDLATANQPRYVQERQRGRGLFSRVLRFLGGAARTVVCGVVGSNAPQATYTNVEIADREINAVTGTLRTIVHGNMILSLGANMVNNLLCRR